MSRAVAILHADLDAFFASVEQRDDPRLRARPVIVGSGVVLAASYEARAYGVRSAMAGGRARRLCPEALVVQPRWSAYREASSAVFEVLEEAAPVVERVSIDEAFLDVSGLERISGSPREIGARLRRDVRERVGLPITVGAARTRALAKVASGVAKPDGLLVVAPDDEEAFLGPLGVQRLWGVGPITASRLRDRGITTVGELAAIEEGALVALLGQASGRRLHALAHRLDTRPVRARRRRRSVGAQRALGRGRRSSDDLDAVLVALVDRVARRMRSSGRAGRTVVLRLRFDDFSRATRSATLPQATSATAAILARARALLAVAMPAIERRGVTLLGITVANLDGHGGVQLALPLDGVDPDALDAALDDVRARFGPAAVTRAALLHHGSDLSAWLVPGETPAAPVRASPGVRGPPGRWRSDRIASVTVVPAGEGHGVPTGLAVERVEPSDGAL